jgi:GTP-binding protein
MAMPHDKTTVSPKHNSQAASPQGIVSGLGLPWRRVAIIGRPNVGKSTLINRLIGKRRAIVDDKPGVTRDRGYYPVEWTGEDFTLIDTGGWVAERSFLKETLEVSGDFAPLINAQVDQALAEAHVLVQVVDGQVGITPEDLEMAKKLQKLHKPVLVAVNKIDDVLQRPLAAEFYALGLGDPMPLSALHGSVGVGDLLDAIVERFPQAAVVAPASDDEEQLLDEFGDVMESSFENATDKDDWKARPIKLALIGRPNVGKSSIFNAMLGEERAIVSNILGTTRDSLDTTFTYKNAQGESQSYVLLDTAGIRKKARVEYGIERFAVERSLGAVRDADITLLVMDATEGVTDQDKKLIEFSNECGTGLVLVMNQWDKVEQKGPNTLKTFETKVMGQLPHAKFAAVVFTSAISGQRLNKILDLAKDIQAHRFKRYSTSLVNQVLMDAIAMSAPPHVKNKRLKLLYATQVAVAPPTFVLFVNDAKLMKDSYQRYLEGQLRSRFEFSGTPIRLIARSREETAPRKQSSKK